MGGPESPVALFGCGLDGGRTARGRCVERAPVNAPLVVLEVTCDQGESERTRYKTNITITAAKTTENMGYGMREHKVREPPGSEAEI